MKILLLNGPNLDLLGVREPAIYGTETLADVEHLFCSEASKRGVEASCFQSNHEGVLIDKLHEARGEFKGVVYNPAAHTHYSYALRDAIAAIGIPVVEVHISDICARESFRAVSVLEDVCIAQVKGEGIEGYIHALDILLQQETRK
jgi:3-dehydroquinate dehydratase type II